MNLRKLVFDSENPQSSLIATILMVLSIINDAFMQFGAMFGLDDRTISIVSGIFLVATFIYNQLKAQGVISRAKKSVSRLFK